MAAAPDNVLIAAPVDAVPNVVAIAIAAVGPIAATPAPASAPAPATPPKASESLASFLNFSTSSSKFILLT